MCSLVKTSQIGFGMCIVLFAKFMRMLLDFMNGTPRIKLKLAVLNT